MISTALNLAGLGIAFHAKPTVKEKAESSYFQPRDLMASCIF
jgi:phosphoserine phosphatase